MTRTRLDFLDPDVAAPHLFTCTTSAHIVWHNQRIYTVRDVNQSNLIWPYVVVQGNHLSRYKST